MKKSQMVSLLLFPFAILVASCDMNEEGGQSVSSTESSSSFDSKGSDIEILDPLEGYTKSNSVTDFPDSDMAKVNMKPTFDIADATFDASDMIVPYQLFKDGVCLQRDAVNRLWGTIEHLSGNEHIAASFHGKTYYGTVSDNTWEIYLPKMMALGPSDLTLICDWGTKVIKNVYVGEVYLLCGQSNMEWKVGWSKEVLADLYSDEEACKNENIRLLSLDGKFKNEPTKEVATEPVWYGANADSIPEFSAVGYIFGKKMQKTLGCPVGLVCTAIGGTIVESWMDQETYREYAKNYSTAADESVLWKTPSLGFNGMIYPLEGFNFRGVTWYQGCSSIYGAEKNHDKALKALVSSWRKFFKNPDLTWSMAELARFYEDPLAYSIINEKIGVLASEDDLVLRSINLDQGDWTNIHPVDKRAIGTRLANDTLRKYFGYEENEAPKIASYTIVSKNEVKITMNEDVVLKNGANGFEILTENGYSFNCNASLSGRAVTVTSSDSFKGIRYGYDFPKTAAIVEDVSKTVTIYDMENLPCDMFSLNF